EGRIAEAAGLRSVARRSIDGGSADLGLRMTTARPRLMATPAATARTKRLLAESETLRRWQGEVTKQADLLLGLTPLPPDWVHERRETAAAPLPLVRAPRSPDGPAAPLDIARLFCLRILTLGLTWLLTAEPRYCERAKAELLAVCTFPDWSGDKFLVTA